MAKKEALARIKINQLLIEAGWRFFDDDKGNRRNIECEYLTKFKKSFEQLGDNFQKVKIGFLDFLLLNYKGFPVAVVEAKKAGIDPLDAKGKARQYADSLGLRHIFLSNGDTHYYWDLQAGNPKPIRRFLTEEQLGVASKFEPDISTLVKTKVDENYIAYSQDANWAKYTAAEREEVRNNKPIKILRDYQLDGVKAIQEHYAKGSNRFLFEMATGTGKTLLSGAIIKLFLSTGNAERVLFLVDRIELEQQANDNFAIFFKEDNYKAAIYKENRHTWENAQIVVTTIQSLSSNEKYKSVFLPSDFQLIISDEAHRTISGNNKTIFEYFIGAKLGLTATPKNYLRGINVEELSESDPRQLETRLLKDTYTTFGCESGRPTFSFDLKKAVSHKPPYLCNPYVLDVRTDVTVDLLSKRGWVSAFTENEEEEENEEQEEKKPGKKFFKKDFEKAFFSPKTNEAMMSAFMKHAKRDPITGEIGKTIIYAVRRKHATKLLQMLNDMADKVFPGKYNSDFAIQITSNIDDAAQKTKDFNYARTCLNGYSRFNEAFEDYKTSKTRVCITVGMMTTGYDCEDLLNVVLCRPIFSPTDFVQIKGRGTRLATFSHPKAKKPEQKDNFHLFDFFANHEFFDKDFDYDKKIELPKPKAEGDGSRMDDHTQKSYDYSVPDEVKQVEKLMIGVEGMKIDREMFRPVDRSIASKIEETPEAKKLKDEKNTSALAKFFEEHILNKPKEYWTMEKISKEHKQKRILDTIEYMEYLTGKRVDFRSDNDYVNDLFEQFYVTDHADTARRYELQRLFSSFLLNPEIRSIIEKKEFGFLDNQSELSPEDLSSLGKAQIKNTLNYIKENQILQRFNI